jgi:hypothetical protein
MANAVAMASAPASGSIVFGAAEAADGARTVTVPRAWGAKGAWSTSHCHSPAVGNVTWAT